MMEGNVFEMPLNVKMMASEKKYRQSQLEAIVAIICALLNSDGGNLNVKLNNDDSDSKEKAGDVLRMIEQRLIDIIGSRIFYMKVRTQRLFINSEVRFEVDPADTLCTIDYHLYMPTLTQVMAISSSENPKDVKAILDRPVRDNQLSPLVKNEDFVFNRQVLFAESDSTQFKQLKAEKSKCVSLADRITNKSNKLERYISAFANKKGGRIFYGIKDDDVVKGEDITDQECRNEIVRKVTKAIDKMIWSKGKLERGRHWNIQFAPVKDEKQDEIPSLFVVIISVVPLCGGLFTYEPESYVVVHSRYERMSFAEWSRRFFGDEQSVPSSVGRTAWSSVKTQINCHRVLQSLLKYQNDGDLSGFECFAESAKNDLDLSTEVQLIISLERSVCAYKTGQFENAERLIDEYEHLSFQQLTKDFLVFKLRTIYARSAFTRAKGNYHESYAIAQEGLQQAEMAPAGILVAWFYTHVATVEKRLSKQTKEEAERARLAQISLDHYDKALQHTKASSVEQVFRIIIADLQQRIHIFRAITLLGDFPSGGNFREATPSAINAAERDLAVYSSIILHGSPVSRYREISHLFSLSDLRLCQWWQQRQQETAQEERTSENDATRNFLWEAFDYAKKGKELAIKSHFKVLTNYGFNRLAKIEAIYDSREIIDND